MNALKKWGDLGTLQDVRASAHSSTIFNQLATSDGYVPDRPSHLTLDDVTTLHARRRTQRALLACAVAYLSCWFDEPSSGLTSSLCAACCGCRAGQNLSSLEAAAF